MKSRPGEHPKMAQKWPKRLVIMLVEELCRRKIKSILINNINMCFRINYKLGNIFHIRGEQGTSRKPEI